MHVGKTEKNKHWNNAPATVSIHSSYRSIT